ncbi:Fanconi anemia group D2 protein isoform X2 [Spea bombifrons]|nr:Fanconi anemia group D2 protein isoform X2 [Spea bombifrons]
MVAKRRLSKSDDRDENLAPDTTKAKKSRISTKKPKAIPQDGLVENDSLFVQLLKSSGMTLRSGDRQNEIAVDQAVFQKKLQQSLRKHPRYPDVIQEFVSSLESHIEDRDLFRNCLLPCGTFQAEDASHLNSSFHDSLIKLLLGTELLQDSVINLLFEKLPEFLYESVGSDGISIPRLIINQFKWLDRVVNCKDLSSKIMQLVVVAPIDIQHDIITSLPEILEDSQHNDIAKELNCLLQKNIQLTVPILDALSSLNLNAGLLIEVRRSVMSTLSAVELEDLPVIIKFILHSVTPSDAVEVISELRQTLDLETCVSLTQIQASQIKTKNSTLTGSTVNQTNSSKDCVSLLMDVMKSAVRFQKHTSEAWIKAIESVNTVADHKVTDLIVLLILYTTNNSKKQVERVLRNKIRLGYISDQLLQSSFRNHSQVLREYFPSILSLAQTLLRSAEPNVVSFSSFMYKRAFSAFDSYCQQEVVGALVTHVCSGYAGEVDVSLNVLTELVSNHSTALTQYAVFIKGILDYLDNLNAQQIRKLFQILSMLAFNKGQEGGHIQDDMYIVIRKQLSSTLLKYKRIGIIGAVQMVGSMAVDRKTKSGAKDPGNKPLGPDCYKQVAALLQLVCTCIEKTPEASALYYDEMASLVQKRNLEPQVMDLVRKTVLEDFQDDFVVDLDQASEGNYMFPVKAMYSLDEDESQGGIVINLLPLLSKEIASSGTLQETNKVGRHVSPLCLSPFFRLLRLCIEDEQDGNLEEIDALLGCPLYMTDLEVTEKLESISKSEREFLCSLLFFALNWFREVVNAFCKQQNAEMKGKVLTRLQNITRLQEVLEKCLSATPAYIPPPANFDSESQEAVPSPAPATAAKKTKKGKKKKSAESKNSSADSSQIEEHQDAEPSEVDKSQPEKEKEDNKLTVSLNSYRAFFRELDLDVFIVLQCGLVTRSILDSELHTKATEVVQLGPAELVFLLEDLTRKMEHILTSNAKRPTFLKVKGSKNIGFSLLHQKTAQEVAQAIVDLLNSLCNHVENMHSYFQLLMAENPGVEDAPAVDAKEHQYMSYCYQLLLQVFHTLFAWGGFSQHENRKLLKSALGVLAGRLKEVDAELALEELASQSFSYLQNLHTSVPTCSSALCLIQLLIVLTEKTNATQYQNNIASLAKRFLCQSWVQTNGEREKGIRFNETLQSLLCIYLERTDDVLKAVEEIAGVGIPELVNADKDGSSSTYPTLTRQTFVVFFRVLMDKLEKCARNIPAGKNSDSNQIQTEQLLRWSLAVRDFHILVNLVKVFDSRPVLSVCLKYGRLFLETFLKLGMPLLDNCFKKLREDVQSLLKTLQLSTRQLHHMCGHSKIHQDTGLTHHVPLLKKTLELFVYRVKAMLVLNKCQEAFWLGNLKNRDLQGEEILSQVPMDSEAEEEQESQLPAEEEDAEEDEDNEGSNKEMESGDDTEEDSV